MSGAHWRPPASVPPWVAAILTVAGLMLLVNALPMIAAAITPDRAPAGPTISVPPSPVPLPNGRPIAAPPSPLPLDRKSSAAPSGAGTPLGERPAKERAPGTSAGAAETPPPAVRGLPRSGGNPGPSLAFALVLLSAGLALVKVMGCSGDRPWPGRYVRRIG